MRLRAASRLFRIQEEKYGIAYPSSRRGKAHCGRTSRGGREELSSWRDIAGRRSARERAFPHGDRRRTKDHYGARQLPGALRGQNGRSALSRVLSPSRAGHRIPQGVLSRPWLENGLAGKDRTALCRLPHPEQRRSFWMPPCRSACGRWRRCAKGRLPWTSMPGHGHPFRRF